jgi:hypothetical protein
MAVSAVHGLAPRVAVATRWRWSAGCQPATGPSQREVTQLPVNASRLRLDEHDATSDGERMGKEIKQVRPSTTRRRPDLHRYLWGDHIRV